jgi:hypothetical protein
MTPPHRTPPAGNRRRARETQGRDARSRDQTQVHLGAALVAYATVMLVAAIVLLLYGPQSVDTGVASTLLTTVAGTTFFGGLKKLGVRIGSIFR